MYPSVQEQGRARLFQTSCASVRKKNWSNLQMLWRANLGTYRSGCVLVCFQLADEPHFHRMREYSRQWKRNLLRELFTVYGHLVTQYKLAFEGCMYPPRNSRRSRCARSCQYRKRSSMRLDGWRSPRPRIWPTMLLTESRQVYVARRSSQCSELMLLR